MTPKDYIQKAHHGFMISYDDDLDEELVGLRQRSSNAYTVTKDDYKSFERSMDNEPNFDCPQTTASGLRGPQGTKNTWDGETFDSKWEYAFYRYHKEVCGDIIKRNHSEWFPYYDNNGKQRKFYYDFDVNSVPYEVKGIFRESDLLKQQSTAGIVVFVTGDDIKPMMKELDAKVPTWRTDCIEI